MRLKKFVAKNVHGFLDFDIDFFSEVTFLIGINGSGKTSALKLILGLTTPSYFNLSSINYDYCEITAYYENKEIRIRSAQEDETHFRVFLEIDGYREKSNLIKRNIGFENELEDDSDEFKSEGWRSIFNIDNVIAKIKSFNTPKFLGLERRVLDEFGAIANNDSLFRFRKRINHNKYFKKNIPFNSIDSGLFDVQILVFDYIRSIAQQQPIISSEFKDKIFKQSFNFISGNDILSLNHGTEDLEQRKENVVDAVKKLDLSYLVPDVENYFAQMIEVSRKMIEDTHERKKIKNKELDRATFTLWLNNFPQLKKIDEIIEFSEEYQIQLEKLRTPIGKLEKIASKFLNESNKFLKIEPDGEIRVYYKNGNSADIYKLSSGEKQIIIMIAHLIFAEDLQSAGVFIIDEPELSLHIAWQEIFVDAILEASPNTQFILATHSPSIISKVEREQYCQDISNSYNA